MTWRHSLLILIPLAGVIGVFAMPPISQEPAYHLFADTRDLAGIPNIGNVLSNGAFLIAGLIGLHYLRRHGRFRDCPAWWVFFIGVAVITFGSGYYHWQPGNGTLVWDRLSMTIAFTAVTAAFIADYVLKRLGSPLLFLLVPLGAGSVWYWHLFNDLRAYFAIQGMVFLTLLTVLFLFGPKGRERGFILLALGSYAFAFLFEQSDGFVFGLTGGTISGHSIKHLFAGLAPYWLFRLLSSRTGTR